MQISFQKLLAGFGTVISLFLTFRTLGKKWKSKPLTNPKIIFSKYRKLRRFIEAQARHETNNYQSFSYKEDNNLFGMKNASKRKQLGIEKEDRPYRVYSSPSQSIEDFILYLDFVNFPEEVENLQQYVEEMKIRNYFEDSSYNYFRGANLHYQNLD